MCCHLFGYDNYQHLTGRAAGDLKRFPSGLYALGKNRGDKQVTIVITFF